MQDTPDIDLRLTLDIEDQIGKLSRGSKAKAGNIHVMRIAGRAAPGLFTDTATGVFDSVDEGERDRWSRLDQIMLDRLINIAPRLLAQNNRFAVHYRAVSRTLSRSWSK